MGQIIIRLFFYGAIAFVPDSMHSSAGMTAYLLNIDGDCKHTPLLTFHGHCGLSSGKCDNPIASDKTCCGEISLDSDTYCVCKLIDERIVLDPAPERIEKSFKLRPGEVLPSPGKEGDFAWLLRIANIDNQASYAKTTYSILKMTPKVIEAYVGFSWGSAQVCHVDQNYYGGKYEVDEFEFKNKQGDSSSHTQALAEYAEFSGYLAARPVHVSLESIGGKRSSPIRILLDCSKGSCPDLFFSNSLSGNKCDDEDVGTHFTHYYNLSRSSHRGLVPYRTDRKTSKNEQYSCGPAGGPVPPQAAVYVNHPLAALRRSLVRQLEKELCDPALLPSDLAKLDGVMDLFGRSSGELAVLLEKASKGTLDGCKGQASRQEIDKKLGEWRKGIASRVICPMAMLDP